MIITQTRTRIAARSLGAPVCNSNASSAEDARRVPCESTDIDMAHRGRTNVLLIGPRSRCDAVVATLGLNLPEPIAICRAREGLVLPSHVMAGTLILRDVDALVHADQRRLLDWLGGVVSIKVISTATASLLPKMERGAFLDSLYYRLNTICILMPVDARGLYSEEYSA